MFNRADAGVIKLNPEAIDLEKFCLDLVESTPSENNHKPIINLDIQSAINPVYLDVKILQSILSNLLSNAVKYSPDDQEINFKVICQSEKVVFSVQDQGIGIPSEDIPHLFEAFHRGNNVNNIPGSGLGLTILKKFVDLYNGKIEVTSEVNLGTTFTVTLPLKNHFD
jgi:signal transduction histidine kinase